ncbi:methyltransferase family protein [Candidatus Pelagibacter ubique]|uniref:Methyltransferase family protein n=1 Tax=Pelagibacter ubique TaxID=198252 RepID=A0ABX1T1L0_PELUQ|nr:class I SAM-dependent methyltransferase [Candidatus Pelagibacter ubique]NMN67100.1 methyltransferase family protein [Candidatus Pelagibacter ubique]|tara:strand:- start:2042 stop:2701 length:660 start_codon:yes stop_codon:yes gene_type:complete
MSLKKEYFHFKLNKENNDVKRDSFAKREFDTISYILKQFYNVDLKKGFKILDLGAGDKFLEKIFDKNGILYHSLDIEDLDFEKDKFNFDDNQFDLIISLAVLEHLKNPDIFLQESMRVLKKDSLLFLSTPNWKYCKNSFFDDVTHVKPYTPESLQQLLEIKGFKEVMTMPNLRCKSKKWYQGKFRFFKAYYLLPFKGDTKFISDFLKGKSKGLFAIGKK